MGAEQLIDKDDSEDGDKADAVDGGRGAPRPPWSACETRATSWEGVDSQEAQSEDQEEADLLPYRDDHGPDHRDGNEEDQEVGGDVQADGSPHVRDGFAVSVDGGVPVGLQRDAQRHGRDEAPDVVDDDDGQHEPGGAAGPLELEDADVQEQNGHLGEREAELVEELQNPAGLWHHDTRGSF